MSELINGRTPEEIKHVTEWACFSCGGLECDECEYRDACTIENRDRAVPDALALIQHLESERDAALAKVPKWISVQERLPEEPGEYLASSNEYVITLEYDGEKWHDIRGARYFVDAWMPKPEGYTHHDWDGEENATD